MLSREDVWDQPAIYETAQYDITANEFEDWIDAEKPDVVFFDQNYQFDEIAKLRRRGIKTVARFVWERFSREHVEPAMEAISQIYAITECEHQRYAGWGLQLPRVRWGCHPETLSDPELAADEPLRFFFPATDQRKWTEDVLHAWQLAQPKNARLIVKTQAKRRDVQIQATTGVEQIADDLSFNQYHQLMASCHACIAPSKWEGLGLHVYEALSHGLPLIAIDRPPVNEPVRHGCSGLLLPGTEVELSPSGIPGCRTTPDALAEAICYLADADRWRVMAASTLEQRDCVDWATTESDVDALLHHVIEAS